ncbi:MAG: AIM24 family protein, partial [Chrysiogenetes bacterium]|nr:AIM24 family protein [Chrysiogenetes bacterium]
ARKMVAEMEAMIDKRRQGMSEPPASAGKPVAPPPAPGSAAAKLENEIASEAQRTEESLIDAAQRRRELLSRRRTPDEVQTRAAESPKQADSQTEPPAAEPKSKPEPVAPPRKTQAPAPKTGAPVEVVPLVREDAPALLLETPGLLRISLEEPSIARLTESAVVRGEVKPEPLYKRFRGQTTTTVFGSKDAPFCTISGSGNLFLQAALGQTLYALDTEPKEKAFISERALCAFTGKLIWENGRIGSEKVGSIDLVTIYGEGTFVVSSAGAPTQMQVEDEDLLISHKTLIGWVGKFAPRVVSAPNGVPPEVGPMIRLKGTGRVLIGRL